MTEPPTSTRALPRARNAARTAVLVAGLAAAATTNAAPPVGAPGPRTGTDAPLANSDPELRRAVEEAERRWRALPSRRPADDGPMSFATRLAETELQQLRMLAARPWPAGDATSTSGTKAGDPRSVIERADRLNALLDALEARAGTPRASSADADVPVLAGRVVDPDGLPLEGAVVTVYREDGSLGGLALTDRLGAYRVAGLHPGTVEIVVRGPGIVPTVRGERACAVGCVRQGPALELPKSGVVRQSFRTTAGASIAGTVRDAVTAAPIEVAVYAFVGSSFAGFDVSDPTTGAYEITGLASGVEHHVRTNGAELHVDEVWDDVPCPGGGCQAFQVGTPLTPVEGEPAPVADFDLLKGGFLEVTVTDAGTASAIPSATIFLSENGYSGDVFGVTTDAGGVATSPPVLAGDYYVGATATSYVPELYDDVHCVYFGQCDPSGATPLTVVTEQTTSVSLPLDVGASIAGTVRDEETGDPLTQGQVTLYDATGGYLKNDLLSGGGGYLFSSLPAGTYFLATQTRQASGHFDEIYDNIPYDYSAITSGTPVAVALGDVVAGIDFDLALGGGFQGTLRTDDEVPLAWRYLRVFDGSTTTRARTDGNGDLVVRPLDPGTYYVSTDLNDVNYLEEMWQDVPCDGYLDCDWSLATPIVITGTDVTPGIDIRVARSSRIRGTVIAATGGAPVAGATIGVAGSLIRATTTADGSYTLAGLQPGAYQLWASHPDFQRQSLGGGYCPETTCPDGLGDVVVLTAEETVTGVDFALDAGGVVQGTVTARLSGDPLYGVILYAYDATGLAIEGATTAADGTYRTAPMPTDGPVYLSTFIAPDGFLRETYENTRATFGFLNNQPLQVLQGDPLTFGPTGEATADLALDLEADAHQMTFQTEVAGRSPGGPGGSVGDGWEACTDPSCVYPLYPDGATFDLVADPRPSFAFLGWSGDPDCLDGTVTLTGDLTCRATFEPLEQIFVDGFEGGSTSGWSWP